MAYIIPSDYLMQIDPSLRNQINRQGMARAENVAIEEINGYFVKRYDTGAEFTDTALYNINTIYRGNDRVYINYPTYDATATYNIGNYISNGNYAYVCNSNGVTGAFNATFWTLIGTSTTLYYCIYPYSLFNIYGDYKLGDKVFWANHIYTCKQSTGGFDNSVALQYYYNDALPLNNVFPNDTNNGAANWIDNGLYTVPANSLNSPQYDPTATYTIGQTVTYIDNCVYICTKATTGDFDLTAWLKIWQIGDNRSQLMITHVVNIALYWAHYSIAPNNVPESRIAGYEIAKA